LRKDTVGGKKDVKNCALRYWTIIKLAGGKDENSPVGNDVSKTREGGPAQKG